MRLLLVEDEPEMAANLNAALVNHGIVVDWVSTLQVAEEAVAEQLHDAVLLDRKLPDGDGLSFITYLRRKRPGVPVIVLSALDSSTDRVAGLDVGADDYLGKPFSVDELMARLRAVLRRGPAMAQGEAKVGNLVFDLVSREARVAGASLALRRRELLVLEALMRRSGRTVVRTVLEEAVFGFNDEIQSNSLDAHVSRLRKKLADGQSSAEIHAIRGIGYLIKERQ